jgi:hypothetical protein
MYHLEGPDLNEKHSVHTDTGGDRGNGRCLRNRVKQKVSGEKETHRWQHKHRSTLLL